MTHPFKVTSYAFIVALVPLLLLPYMASALPHPQAPTASSCKGWECGKGTGMMDPKNGSICWEGSPGASDASYVCHNDKWTEFEPTLCIHELDGPDLIECMEKATRYMPSCMKHYSDKWKNSDLCTDTSIACLSEDWRAKVFQLAIGVVSGKYEGAQAQCHDDWKQLIHDLSHPNPYAKGCFDKKPQACYDSL